MDNIPYTLCQHCDHFVDPNDCLEDYPPAEQANMAKFVHLEDGEQEFDHDAAPGETKTGAEWKQCRPDLFKEHPDKAIGPNSFFHSRRGKLDGLWYVSKLDKDATTLYRKRLGVAEKLFSEYDFEPDAVKETGTWHNDGDVFSCLVYLEMPDDEPSRKVQFILKFKPTTTQVEELSCE